MSGRFSFGPRSSNAKHVYYATILCCVLKFSFFFFSKYMYIYLRAAAWHWRGQKPGAGNSDQIFYWGTYMSTPVT